MKRRDEADRLVRLLVSRRHWCQRCGGEGCDTAHIMRRRFNATRCDERNLWWLCRACHDIVDGRRPTALPGDPMTALIETTIGMPAYYELRQRAYDGPKAPSQIFWAAEVHRLKERLREEGLVS